jgi:hypothetical protein
MFKGKISSKSTSVVIKYANVLYIRPIRTNHHISWYLKDLLESFWSPFFFLESIRESCIAIHFDFIPNSTQLFKKISYWICTLNTARL